MSNKIRIKTLRQIEIDGKLRESGEILEVDYQEALDLMTANFIIFWPEGKEEDETRTGFYYPQELREEQED